MPLHRIPAPHKLEVARMWKNAMAFIETPNTALAELRYLWRNQVCENTLWFEKAAPFSISDLEDVADALYNDFWNTALQPLISSECALIGIRVTAQDSTTAPVFDSTFSSPSSGGAGPSVVNNSTWAIQFKTAERGRSYRGRNYMCGIPQEAVSGNYLVLSQAGLYVGIYENLLTFPTSINAQHVVVSHYTGGGARAFGLTTPVIAYGYADLALDSMRRRLPGRGS